MAIESLITPKVSSLIISIIVSPFDNGSTPSTDVLLLENSSALLLEDGSLILLEK